MFLAVVFMTATHEPAHSLIKGSVSTQRPSAGEWLTKCSMDICLHVIQPYRGRDRDTRHSTHESWNHVYRVTQKQILCGLLMWATQTSYSRRRREESWGCHKHRVQVKVVSIQGWEKVLQCCIMLRKLSHRGITYLALVKMVSFTII